MKHKPDAILDTAVGLFAAEGVGVSTSRLAKAAGVSNGTLFNYFPTKQDLLDALYLRLKGEFSDALGDIDAGLPLRDQARLVWDRWIAWSSAHPEQRQVSRLLHEAGLVSEAAALEAQQLLAGGMAVLGRLHQSGELADLPVDYLGALIQSQLELAVETGLTGPELDLAFDVMWNGITKTTISIGVHS